MRQLRPAMAGHHQQHVSAERRLGEMLREMERHDVGRPEKTSHDVTITPPTLSGLGISRMQSSRWQQVAFAMALRGTLNSSAAAARVGCLSNAATRVAALP